VRQNVNNVKSYFLVLPKIPKLVVKHPRNPQKATQAWEKREGDISSVKMSMDCKFPVKITVTNPENKNQRPKLRAPAWLPFRLGFMN